MGRKPKYSKREKIQAYIDYLSGQKSAVEIAQELNMPRYGAREVHKWSKEYESFGENAFEERPAKNLAHRSLN